MPFLMTEKRPLPLSNNLVLSLDFGGTKLAAGLVDLEHGKLLAARRIPTPPDAARSLAAMLELALGLLAGEHGQAVGAGVSFGGLVEKDGRTVLRSHHVSGWDGFPLAARLETELHLPARVANDADTAALGEYHFGAGQGVRSLLYLTVSTGIGAGIIQDGALCQGENGQAGEIGHMLLLPDGPLCPCGRRGCLEALASGRSIARQMRQKLAENGSLEVIENITAQSVAEAAAAGNPLACSVWDAAMRWLGIGIANAANLLNPGRVVVGGGLSRAGALLFEPVQRVVAQIVLDPTLQITPAALDDDSPLLGAAMLVKAAL